MTQYSPKQIENMMVNGQKKAKLSEPLGGRGEGTLIFKQQGQEVEAYYRYRHQGKDRTLAIGRYGQAAKVGMTLPEIRDKARELARLKKEIAPVDLKEYLELDQLERLRQQEAQKKQAEMEAKLGSLKDLCESYVASLERRSAASSRDVKNCLSFDLLSPFPKLCSRKSNDITTEDLMPVFRRMLERKVTTKYNRFRSFLMAAFNFGMKSDYDPRHQLESGKRFHIQFNPVTAIPKYAEFERVRDRTLSNAEICRLWHDLEQFKQTWSPLYGLLLKFCLACYGNRPEQLNHIQWTDIDWHRRVLRFIDTKGKNAVPKKRVIPLTDRALSILEEARKIAGDFSGPFMITGKSPIDVSNLGSLVSEYNDSLQDRTVTEGQWVPERFTAKDLRRTCTRLFTDRRVLKEHRYLLQSREDGSVESRHYDHDDRLEEKRDVAKIYDDYLGSILNGSSTCDEDRTVVDIQHYRELA
ncbi:integrase family protein [Endozoicomonas sp. 8E]|uniref:tyrosine-type recombinase/integrase n=1 Tax=Endozoicomonas sp. 8E TaxID=3035692 RepID=UPI0029394429|nr:integrase family protein [Endozoicomonas sp. 8E]WOG27884.1 integrase family protein [Endozoicomonas sp. 8E]